MKKTFTLLVFSIFFVSCSMSFAAENNNKIKPFDKVDFSSLLYKETLEKPTPQTNRITRKDPYQTKNLYSH